MLNLTAVMLFASYVALISALLVILAPTPLHMIFFGMLFYLSFGSLFISNNCDFIGIILITVYAGALMVMFLFVLMLFSASRSSFTTRASRHRFNYLFLSLVFAGCFVYLFSVSCSFLRVGSIICTLGKPTYIAVFCSPISVSYQSVLSGIAFTFYQIFPLVVILCGLALTIGLVGAVGLADNSTFLALKRRVVSPVSNASNSEYRVVLVRSVGRTGARSLVAKTVRS